MAHSVTLIPGDGIGPEVIEATVEVLEATTVDFDWDRFAVGKEAVENGRSPLPDEVLASIKENGVALKGPVTTPVGKGFRSVNVQLRQKLDLFANVRPCHSLPGLRTRFEDVELDIIRENTEGLYAGMETYDERLDIADATARITRAGSERIVKFAFDYTRAQGRRKLVLVHKANILKATSGLFLEIGREIAEQNPDITFSDLIVDNMALQLVTHPEDYECLVTTNLFGDILSDLGAGLVGGLGVVPGANVGEDCAVYEPVHGSAPDIAGEGVANPTAAIRSAVLMLRWLGERKAAENVEQAINGVYRRGQPLTPDVGGSAGTTEFVTGVVNELRSVRSD